VMFVSPTERRARIEALREVGVAAVLTSWQELVELLVAPSAHGCPRGGSVSLAYI
jgi:hypothetical protein